MSDQQWQPAQPYPAAQPQMLPTDQPWPGYAQAPYPQQTQSAQPNVGAWEPTPGAGCEQQAFPAPPGPGPRRKRGLLLALCGGGLALLLVVIALLIPGGGASGASSASGGGGGQLKTLWAVPNQQGRKLTDMSGAWATAGAVIDVRQDGAVAYKLSTGEQLWGWQPPDNDPVCAMAAAVSSDVGVAGYGNTAIGAGGGCDHLVGIDTSSGKTLWTINLDPKPSGATSTHIMVSNPHIAVSGDTLAAVSEDNTLSSYDLTTGKLRWSTPDELGNLSDDCNPEGLQAAGGQIYELSTCTTLSASSAAESLQLQDYQADASSAPSPSTLSTSGITGGTYVELWAAGNWIFVTTGGATGGGKALGYAVGEGSTTPIPLDLSVYNDDAFGNSLSGEQNNRGFAINGDTLYIEDKMTGNEYGVSAVNLHTGQRIWDQQYGGNAELTVLDASAEGVRAIASVQGQGGYQLVNLAAASGAVAKGPSTSDSRFEIDSTNTVVVSGTYLVDVSAMSIGSMPAVVCLSGVRS